MRRHLILPLVMLVQAVLHSVAYTHAAQVGLITIPWLLNRGGALYGNVLEHRAPLLAWTVALAQRLIPVEPITLLLGLNLVLVLGVSVGVYVITLRLTQRPIAAGAALLTWAWWEPSYGNILFYFDSVLGALFLAVVAVWAFHSDDAPSWRAPLLTGFILGTGVLVKQHGGGAAVLVGLWLLVYGRYRITSVAAYAFAGILPAALVLVYQANIGNLSDFLYWTVTFNLSGDVPPLPPTSAFVYKMLLTHLMVPAFALFTLRSEHRRERTLLLVVWAAGTVTLIPKVGEIHTMALLPAVAVMTGWAAADILPSGIPNPRRWLASASPTAIGLGGVVL
ncbi:MAG: hypothetical protein AAF125_19220, partial [Chloroflexota bacterium]